MNTKHISLAFAAAAALLAGCAKSSFEEPIDGQFADLELSYVGATETKATIDGTAFPTDGEIGLFLFENEQATTPYGDGYANVKYSYNSSKSKWTASPSIKVGSTPGYLYGYYPYSNTATDIKAIPVSSSLNGDDVMYASKQSSPITDETAANTAITMNHALARVSITVKNNGYTGEAKLSQIKFEGAKLAASGTLDATSGIITATKADNVALSVPEAGQTIATGDGTTYECLLVPSAVDDNKQTVTLTLTIDGEPKTATLSGNDNGVIFAQGTKSNITITLSNSGISVQTVSVEDWKVVEIGGHKVTITVADGVTASDIMYGAYVDGDNVVIRASSYSGQRLKCTMADGEFCTSQSKTVNFVYTFTISDVTSNTTATIGYAKPVSIGVTPSGAGSVEITGEAYEGETGTLKANSAYKYGFDAWLNKDSEPLSCEEETYSDVRLTSGISVKFKENLILGGEFTVNNEGKKVRFTRGNLYRDSEGCKIEQHQYDFNSASYTSSTAHVSHFMWCGNIANSTSKQYDDSWNSQSPFFTENNFTVSGFSENQCHTLTNEEWQYLFSYGDYDNEIRSGKYTLGVTVCGKWNCVVLLPDNWTGGTIESSYDYVGWKQMEAAGAVCLPAAGYRLCVSDAQTPEIVSFAGDDGYYWSASTNSKRAYYLRFYKSGVNPGDINYRGFARSVRLVTYVTE